MPVLPITQSAEGYVRQAAGGSAAPGEGASASRTKTADTPQPAPTPPTSGPLTATASRDAALEFEYDGERAVIKVIDRETNKVLRQIPPEEWLALARMLERLQGLLVNLKA